MWSLALVVEPGPYPAGAVFLIGLGMITLATSALVGIVVVGGIWAQRLGLVSIAATGVVAVVRPVDVFWMIGLAVSFVATVFLLTPPITRSLRQLPSATGPPRRAVLVTSLLLATPLILGLVAVDRIEWTTLVVGLSAPIVAFWYLRVLPGGLYLLRYAWPLLALGLAFTMDPPAALATVAIALATAVTAMDTSIKAAFYPPRERGSAYPIPPELAPGEILDAANLDERGRPR